jgi:hypothetical protein
MEIERGLKAIERVAIEKGVAKLRISHRSQAS